VSSESNEFDPSISVDYALILEDIMHCDSLFIVRASKEKSRFVACAVAGMHESLEAGYVSTEGDDSAASQWTVPCCQKESCIAIACLKTLG
jgi:hypothetical protein